MADRMSLRGEPVEKTAVLPDGRRVLVRVSVPDDPYVPKRQLNTVDIELFEGVHPLAAVTTLLRPEQTSEALRLARAIVAGLESGSLQPTAGAIEPLADSPPRV
jgi:hypothetical protein